MFVDFQTNIDQYWCIFEGILAPWSWICKRTPKDFRDNICEFVSIILRSKFEDFLRRILRPKFLLRALITRTLNPMSFGFFKVSQTKIHWFSRRILKDIWTNVRGLLRKGSDQFLKFFKGFQINFSGFVRGAFRPILLDFKEGISNRFLWIS